MLWAMRSVAHCKMIIFSDLEFFSSHASKPTSKAQSKPKPWACAMVSHVEKRFYAEKL